MKVSISNNSNPPVVLLDTTVLCGALRIDGLNRQLLKLASDRKLFYPIISRVCLMEFYKKSLHDGISKTIYPEHLVHDFLDYYVYPILDRQPAVNSVVGRHHLEIVKRNEMDTGIALAEISETSKEDTLRLAKETELQHPLRYYDEQDVHVWVTALQNNCSFIVTNNTKRFPETIGQIKRIKPGDFYNDIMD